MLRCTDAVKLQWLQSSVKGEKVPLIRHLSLTEANYLVARQRLEKKYNKKEAIKHSLIQTVLGFKCESNPRFTQCTAAITGFNNALEELRTVHEVDTAIKVSFRRKSSEKFNFTFCQCQ